MENYVNYFTEIELFYLQKRGTFRGRLSSLDWVLVEGWKEQGIPLDMVLKGIDRAFSHAKRDINCLAYCMKAIAEVCNEQKDMRTEVPEVADFSPDEVSAYLQQLAGQVRAAGFPRIAESIEQIDATDLKAIEQQLSALEEKLVAHITVVADDASILEVHRAVDGELSPFRSTMTAGQLAMLEQQLRRRKLLDKFRAPRLSLFYLI